MVYGIANKNDIEGWMNRQKSKLWAADDPNLVIFIRLKISRCRNLNSFLFFFIFPSSSLISPFSIFLSSSLFLRLSVVCLSVCLSVLASLSCFHSVAFHLFRFLFYSLYFLQSLSLTSSLCPSICLYLFYLSPTHQCSIGPSSCLESSTSLI